MKIIASRFNIDCIYTLRHPLIEKSVTGNRNLKKIDGVMFYVIFFHWSIAQHSPLYLFLSTFPSL